MLKIIPLVWVVFVSSLVVPRVTHAGIPTAGDVISASINVGSFKRIPLPRGQWRVETVFTDPVKLDGGSMSPDVRLNYVILSNIDRQDGIKVLSFEFTSYAKIDWRGQPCDSTRDTQVMLSNDFETRQNSLTIKCNRIRLFEDLRGVIRRSSESNDKWISRALTPFAAKLMQRSSLHIFNGKCQSNQ
jgi:hypothetical protein